MLLDDSLRFFVSNLQPRALVLKGQWGVGKTFYWREKVVKEFFAHANLRREDRGYAYVSLFGLESIQQVKNSLAYSYLENRQPGLWFGVWYWVRRQSRRIGSLVNKGFADEISVGYQGIGAKVRINALLNDFSFLSIKRSLICIDDLERRNQKLSIGDVLGLASYLVDQRHCRVVLILNFDALSEEERAEWERGKDKVFEAELLYQPTLENSVEVGMRGTEFESWHNVVKACLLKLEINNVRVVARAQRFVRQLIEEMKGDHQLHSVADDAWMEIAKEATLLASAQASKNVGAPDVMNIIEPDRASMDKDDSDVGLTPDQKSWKEKIDEYGMYFGDALDKAIANSVVDGFPRMDLLVPAALEWDQIREQHARDQKFQHAWDLYHSSLKQDSEIVFAAFQEALPEVIATESMHNIDSTGRLFRVMGHPDAAIEMFRKWVEARSGDRREELLESSFFPGTAVTDPGFKALIEAARQEEAPGAKMPLVDALKEMDSGSWSEDAVVAISKAEPSAIAEVLRSEGRNWRRCVKTLSNYTSQGDVGKVARANFLRALAKIAATSPLNADRVKNKLGGRDIAAVLEELEAG